AADQFGRRWAGFSARQLQGNDLVDQVLGTGIILGTRQTGELAVLSIQQKGEAAWGDPDGADQPDDLAGLPVQQGYPGKTPPFILHGGADADDRLVQLGLVIGLAPVKVPARL